MSKISQHATAFLQRIGPEEVSVFIWKPVPTEVNLAIVSDDNLGEVEIRMPRDEIFCAAQQRRREAIGEES